MKKLFLFSGLLLGGLILNACAPQATDMPAEPTVVEAESVFGAGTFSFDLPDGWDIFGPEKINDDQGRSYDLYLLGEDPTSSDGPGISQVIVASADQWTPQDLAQAQCSTCLDNGFEEVAVAGKSAQRTQIGGGGVPIVITWYYVENHGNLIAFALHNPQTLAPLDAVIETIVFE